MSIVKYASYIYNFAISSDKKFILKLHSRALHILNNQKPKDH